LLLIGLAYLDDLELKAARLLLDLVDQGLVIGG
jgi:hypothetical protein